MTKPNLAIWKRKSDKNDENAIELTKSKCLMVFASIVKPNECRFWYKNQDFGDNFSRALIFAGINFCDFLDFGYFAGTNFRDLGHEN